MGHIGWIQEIFRTIAFVSKSMCMTDWNQFIFLTMHDKSGARYSIHSAQIIKLFGEKEAKETYFVRCYTLDRRVR